MSSIRIAQESARGAFILFVGNILYTAILTITTIVIARLLGPDEYGIYTLTFVLPGLMVQFVGLGVNTAVTRFIAVHLSHGEVNKARSITRSSATFILLFGAALSGVNFLIAPFFVTNFLHRPDLVSYVQIGSLWVFAMGVSGYLQSTFVGWAMMVETSTFTVLLAVFKLVISVALILAGFEAYGAVLGHVSAYLLSGAIGMVVLYVMRMRPGSSDGSFVSDIESLVRYGLPVFGGQVASGLSSQIATVILATVATNTVVGYFASATNVTVAISVLSGAISLSLYRSFAALHGMKEDISLALDYSMKYSSYILTPVALFLLASAPSIVNLLYGQSYAPSVVLLEIVAVSLLPVGIGWTVLPSFFIGVGRNGLNLLITLVSAIVYAGGSYVLGALLGFQAAGVMEALACSNFAMTIAGLVLSKRFLKTRFPGKPLLGIFLAGSVAASVVWLLPLDGLRSFEIVVLDAFVFVVLYATLVPLFFGVDQDDLVRLSIATETMRPMRTILAWFLKYERLVLSLRGIRRRRG